MLLASTFLPLWSWVEKAYNSRGARFYSSSVVPVEIRVSPLPSRIEGSPSTARDLEAV